MLEEMSVSSRFASGSEIFEDAAPQPASPVRRGMFARAMRILPLLSVRSVVDGQKARPTVVLLPASVGLGFRSSGRALDPHVRIGRPARSAGGLRLPACAVSELARLILLPGRRRPVLPWGVDLARGPGVCDGEGAANQPRTFARPNAPLARPAALPGKTF
jgi:hypothetical protein